MDTVYNMSEFTDLSLENNRRAAELLFRLNHTSPLDDEYKTLLKELFGENIGENSLIMPPIQMVCPEKFKLGRNVLINGNLLAMSMGGVIIGDDVQIAGNVQILTNNHDPYNRELLTCAPVTVKKGAWIGAGASLLPGVTVGKHAIVGACAVVTKDVPDFAVVVGNPAKIVKTLDGDKFPD